MIFLWACRAGEGRGVLTDGSPGTMAPAAPRILLDHIIEHQYQQVRALHWLRGSDHTTHGANSPVEAGAIFLIYWTGDCVNVCPGLVWNREEIINININFLIRRGFNIITSTASNRIHFLGHKINFRNSLCSIKLCLWWPRTEKPWLKCVIVSRGSAELSSNIYEVNLLPSSTSNQNQNCQSGKKENSTVCPLTIG